MPKDKEIVEQVEMRVSIALNTVRLRKKKGLTQAQFARKVGLSRTQITNIEGARTLPSVIGLQKMAKALGTTMDRLAR